MITLLDPVWLLLAIPLAAAMGLWPLPGRWLWILRSAALALVLLALAQLSVELPSRSGTVVVLVDRSRSMPTGAEARALESIELIDRERGPQDELAVIGFGRTAGVELAPGGGELKQFNAAVGDEASDYAAALERAISLIPPEQSGRILVIGDGRWTGRDPAGPAARAAARRLAIDHRLLDRSTRGDVAVAEIQAPQIADPGEAFMITAWVRSPTPQTLVYELQRGDAVIARGRRRAGAGLNRMIFRDTADEPGVQQYRLSVRATGDDPVPENNRADMIVGVEGARPMLHLAGSDNTRFGDLLRNAQLDVETIHGDEIDWTLADLAGYAGLIIDNAPAQRIGPGGMDNVAAWVRQTGAGVMMTGGRTSFGPGGYHKSPIERVLPVSMELRREHRKLALSIVVAMDRSGSMSAGVPGGKTKMDLANLATVQVMRMLSNMDELGVWAVDSQAHRIVERGPVDDKPAIERQIRSIQSTGGGIFVYEALSHAAAMVADSELGTRHIILFADAADSEQPGQYTQLLDKLGDAGITVSVIGLGTKSDTDAELLRDIAQRGNGRVFFTEQPDELPRLFAQDTFVVARSTFVERAVPIRTTGSLTSLTGRSFSPQQPLGGYNLTYLRDGAELAAVALDDDNDYRAPAVASWHVGAGRGLVYTGEVDGEHTGPIARWADFAPFMASLARWTAGERQELPGGAMLTQALASGEVVVRLHLDPKRQSAPFDALPKVRVVHGVPGRPPQTTHTALQWTGPDELTLRTPLYGDETVIHSVDVGDRTVSLAPITLPYSPEFKPADAEAGPATLRRLAEATGGVRRDILGQIWSDLLRKPRLINLAPWLLLAAIGLFLLEVLERRST
ncbi:MAG: VWA domain-containing protein, partial [Alphaproteobacteria bacterium]|nr:VWA domain-containing protein [Alphaproteobacteria bacterium]